MEKIIRWGIAGPGTIANKFALAIKNVKGAELTAVASRTYEKGKEFAEKYDIANVFEGYEKMAESDVVDAVYIATPHPFHKPCAEIFLNAKKHVLCEKPICVNEKQAKILKKCAEENGVFLMEAMWTRFLPAISEAKKIVKSGEIGEIRGVKADFCYFCTPDEDAKLFDNKLAGGSLLDVGVYGLNFAAIFLGNNPLEIKAVSDVKEGVDYQTNIIMKYENGAVSDISCAINTKKPENGYIYGTKGYILLPSFYGAQELFVYSNDNENHVSMPSIGDGFEEEIYEACSCIREGRLNSDIMPMSESMKILSQMDRIRSEINIIYPADEE